MSHLAARSAYSRLTDRLNLFPQGAPPSALLHEILRLLFSEREADLVALLPIKPFTARTAARIWRITDTEARSILETLADRGMLLDTEQDGDALFTLPPLKQVMASRQMKSRYLERLLAGTGGYPPAARGS